MRLTEKLVAAWTLVVRFEFAVQVKLIRHVYSLVVDLTEAEVSRCAW